MIDQSQQPDEPPGSTPESPPAGAEVGRARTITSEMLLLGQQEVLIAHGTEIYRLRLTRNGKLILHK